MKDKVKIICMYLPQFHVTPENSKWWGEGYTEWTAVRNAKKYYDWQKQPVSPKEGNYYDLSDETASTLQQQAILAKKYGIYGFCMYHYWFAGKKMLEKPCEILLNHPEIDIHYSLCWDNNEWKRTWYRNKHEQELLIAQDYGNEEVWTRHFEDLLPFFKDDRYIKLDGKPIFNMVYPQKIDCLKEITEVWNKLAIENGFPGIYFIGSNNRPRPILQDGLDALYNFEPNRTIIQNGHNMYVMWCSRIRLSITRRLNKLMKRSRFLDVRDTKKIYQLMENEKDNSIKIYKGLFNAYDDTPRRQDQGIIYKNSSPELFQQALEKQIENSSRMENEYIFINAWNEWGEGAYLEPDEELGDRYLEAVQKAIQNTRKTKA